MAEAPEFFVVMVRLVRGGTRAMEACLPTLCNDWCQQSLSQVAPEPGKRYVSVKCFDYQNVQR
jgi:hypothetical protein